MGSGRPIQLWKLRWALEHRSWRGRGQRASGSLTYALVEASGSWNLAATTDPDGECAYVTKKALRTIVLTGAKARAAEYSIGKGTLTAKAAVDLVVPTIDQLVDRTNACESLCMGKNPSSCDCIRCLTPVGSQPKPEICEKCKGYGGCAAAGPNVASKVGAYCKMGIFCDTQVECATACPQGFGSCQPYRATCESMCN